MDEEVKERTAHEIQERCNGITTKIVRGFEELGGIIDEIGYHHQSRLDEIYRAANGLSDYDVASFQPGDVLENVKALRQRAETAERERDEIKQRTTTAMKFAAQVEKALSVIQTCISDASKMPSQGTYKQGFIDAAERIRGAIEAHAAAEVTPPMTEWEIVEIDGKRYRKEPVARLPKKGEKFYDGYGFYRRVVEFDSGYDPHVKRHILHEITDEAAVSEQDQLHARIRELEQENERLKADQVQMVADAFRREAETLRKCNPNPNLDGAIEQTLERIAENLANSLSAPAAASEGSKFHQDEKCGGCGGPLELTRHAICETCAPDPEFAAPAHAAESWKQGEWYPHKLLDTTNLDFGVALRRKGR